MTAVLSVFVAHVGFPRHRGISIVELVCIVVVYIERDLGCAAPKQQQSAVAGSSGNSKSGGAIQWNLTVAPRGGIGGGIQMWCCENV